MAVLSLRSFAQTVQDAGAAAQGACRTALDFTVGSVVRVLVEAASGVALWLQYVALQVLSATRLATSVGSDVDSFVGDYSLTRLPAVTATGSVTFSRYPGDTTNQATIPAGSQVKTADGTQTFTVVADTTQAAWNPTANAYIIAAGVTSITATVAAVNSGTAGNVAAGAISLFATSLPYVDAVTNAVGFANGVNAESDAALRARFQLYIAGLASGTDGAVLSAVAGVQQGLTAVITENSPTPGIFVVTVDDGSGHPPTATLNAVFAAVSAVRPVGSIFTVVAPTLVGASVSVVLTLPATAQRPPIVAAVSTAITAYVASLAVGQTLPFAYLAALVFNTSPLIQNAVILLNAGTADLVPGSTGVIRATAITVS